MEREIPKISSANQEAKEQFEEKFALEIFGISLSIRAPTARLKME